MQTAPEQLQTPIAPEERQRPWGWTHALVLQLALVAVAFIVQIARPGLAPSLPAAPWNWVVVGVPVLLAIVAGAIWARAAWMRWLSGAKFAVVSLAVSGLLAAFATFFRGEQFAAVGIHAWFATLPFVVAVSLMLLNLATVTGRRLVTPRRGNLAFVFNHLGLILIVGGVMAGSAQFANPMIWVAKGQPGSVATDDRTGKTYGLGATIALRDFDLEYYPARLRAIVFTGEASSMGDKGMPKHELVTDAEWVKTGHVFTAAGFSAQVLEYLPKAMPDDQGEGWHADEHMGVPAVHVRVTGDDGKPRESWVAQVPMQYQGGILQADERHYLLLADPQPKVYRSHLTITPQGGAPYDTAIEVNKPTRVGQWMLYQSSYGTADDGSYMTGILAVRDPAMPLVYTGFICLLLGAVLACWFAPRKREEPATTPEIPTQDAAVEEALL